MRINITGKSKLSRQEARAAVKFFLGRLVTKRLMKNMIVNLNFVGDGGCGYCSPIDAERYPKEFEIDINNMLSKKEQLITLAHELVHVKQYARNELTQACTGLMKWKKTLFPADFEYFDCPWEREAYALEPVLFREWKASRGVLSNLL